MIQANNRFLDKIAKEVRKRNDPIQMYDYFERFNLKQEATLQLVETIREYKEVTPNGSKS